MPPLDSNASKAEKLARALRAQIATGQLATGSRLPTRAQMSESYSLSLETVQNTMRLLEKQGFIRSKQRAGTFVADHPPHIATIGVIHEHLGASSLFVQSCLTALCNLTDGRDDLHLRFYETSFHAMRRLDTDRLLGDIQQHLLAGLLYIWPIEFHQYTDGVELPGIPQVQVLNEPKGGVPCVSPDTAAFVDRAIEYVRAQGRTRIAHLVGDSSHIDLVQCENGLRRHGLPHDPAWFQPVAGTPAGMRAGRYVARLLMRLEGDHRPDALIIHDDNLLPQVILGLRETDARIPDDLLVLSHANFPTQPVTQAPVVRLGFDSYDLVQRCLWALELQRDGGRPPVVQLTPPLFENELELDAPRAG